MHVPDFSHETKAEIAFHIVMQSWDLFKDDNVPVAPMNLQSCFNTKMDEKFSHFQKEKNRFKRYPIQNKQQRIQIYDQNPYNAF